jgi:hypothetical protein
LSWASSGISKLRPAHAPTALAQVRPAIQDDDALRLAVFLGQFEDGAVALEMLATMQRERRALVGQEVHPTLGEALELDHRRGERPASVKDDQHPRLFSERRADDPRAPRQVLDQGALQSRRASGDGPAARVVDPVVRHARHRPVRLHLPVPGQLLLAGVLARVVVDVEDHGTVGPSLLVRGSEETAGEVDVERLAPTGDGPQTPAHPGGRRGRAGQQQLRARSRRQPPDSLDASLADSQRGQDGVERHSQRLGRSRGGLQLGGALVQPEAPGHGHQQPDASVLHSATASWKALLQPPLGSDALRLGRLRRDLAGPVLALLAGRADLPGHRRGLGGLGRNSPRLMRGRRRDDAHRRQREALLLRLRCRRWRLSRLPALAVLRDGPLRDPAAERLDDLLASLALLEKLLHPLHDFRSGGAGVPRRRQHHREQSLALRPCA